MLRKALLSTIAASIAGVCFAQSTEPVGPRGWTLMNWIGFFVQITLFVLAIIGIYKLAGGGDSDSNVE